MKANEFSVCKVNRDDNTLLSEKKSLRFTYFFFLSRQCTCYNFCYCKVNIVSNILKSKESLRVTFERTKRVSQPGLIDKNDHVIS